MFIGSSRARLLSMLVALSAVVCSKSWSSAGPMAPEVEPNDTKATATPVLGLLSADSITGLSTATSGAGLDYFRISTAPAAAGIYRHQLTLTTTGTAGHTLTIRGLSQSDGVINAGTDLAVQTGQTLTNPARRIAAWYGFGREEQIFCRVAGNSQTTALYTATLATTPVVPVELTTPLAAGSIIISSGTAGAPDTDMWLYDEQFSAIVGAGNDDEFNSSNFTSRLTRTLPPGIYTLAISRFNLANNLASPVDDDSRNGNVLDLPNAVAGSAINPGSQSDFAISFNDGVQPALLVPVTIPMGGVGDVVFVRFIVAGVPRPSGVGSSIPSPVPQGTSASLVISVSPVPGSSFENITSVIADVSAVTGNPNENAVAFTRNGMTADWVFTLAGALGSVGPRTVPFTIIDSGTPSPGIGTFTVTIAAPPPANDTCQTAQPLQLGMGIGGSTINATTNDGPPPPVSCSAGGSNKSVWFSFTPATTANYRITSCGSDFDTVLSIFTIGSCADQATWTLLACDDDSCDGALPPGSAQASEIPSLTLSAGTTYRIRLAGWGPTSAGFYSINIITAIGTGACCSGGCCSITTQAACATLWTANQTCSPTNPCPVPANDSCLAPRTLNLDLTESGDNCSATTTADGPNAVGADCAAGSRGVWFQFVAPASTIYTFSTCGSLIDSVLTIFSGPCNAPVQVACNDDGGCSSPGSSLASRRAGVLLDAGLPYLVRIQSFGAAGSGGTYQLLVTSDNVIGSCCTTSGCALTDAQRCSDEFVSGGTCSPSPCPLVTGACCSGSSCILTTSEACAGPNTRFVGAGIACNLAGNLAAPCCTADFNQSGGFPAATVQDVFDFLSAFFANSPQADLGGGGVTVQDVFDFLTAFFSGAC